MNRDEASCLAEQGGDRLETDKDGEWRKTRLFRAHEQAELSGAIADTGPTFEAKGWIGS